MQVIVEKILEAWGINVLVLK